MLEEADGEVHRPLHQTFLLPELLLPLREAGLDRLQDLADGLEDVDPQNHQEDPGSQVEEPRVPDEDPQVRYEEADDEEDDRHAEGEGDPDPEPLPRRGAVILVVGEDLPPSGGHDVGEHGYEEGEGAGGEGGDDPQAEHPDKGDPLEGDHPLHPLPFAPLQGLDLRLEVRSVLDPVDLSSAQLVDVVDPHQHPLPIDQEDGGVGEASFEVGEVDVLAGDPVGLEILGPDPADFGVPPALGEGHAIF